MGKIILTTVCLGMGTVFVALVTLILLIMIMHAIISAFSKKTEEVKLATVEPKNDVEEIDHNALVVVAATAVAEMLGKDVNAIRIKSITKR